METLGLAELQEMIVNAFPELAGLSFEVLTAGWDCVAVDVDDRLIFKFPRHDGAREALVREAALLAFARPRVSVAVPDLRIHEGPPLFSRHEKIAGEHLLPSQYPALSEPARDLLAATMAGFYAELHEMDRGAAASAGARPIKPWETPAAVREKALPVLPLELRARAAEIVADYESLPPDPHGETFGFFDGHGWNMAFDDGRQQLNGIYDFADSGFGPLHQEFVYSNFLSRDLTERIASAYEVLTGRRLDRGRIDLLSTYQRLSEVVQFSGGPDQGAGMVRAYAEWMGSATRDGPVSEA
jgi:aminoglycoside phosphotransferase (APT) family kinase protein